MLSVFNKNFQNLKIDNKVIKRYIVEEDKYIDCLGDLYICILPILWH